MTGRGRLVLHVLTALDFGGVESQMRLVAAHAAQSGWDHAFSAIGPGGAVQAELRAMGARAVALQQPVGIPSIRATFALWREMRRMRPAVVHLHGAEANFHGLIAARLAGVPVVIAEEIGIPRHSPRARRIFAWVYRRCDRVVAVSQAVKDSILSLGEAPEGAVEVIRNPFAPQDFQPFPPRGEVLEMGFVGRLEPVKNPLAAVEAVALLRDRGIAARLRILGEGSQRMLLERRIADLALEGQVRLEGFDPRPFDRLRGCHLYLQPSLSEGFGLAICEAMSAGLPVIATAVGGAPEIIAEGRTGWLLDRPEAGALAARIAEVQALSDAELAAIAAAGSAHVRAAFGPEIHAARCGALYAALAGGAAP